MYIAQSLLIFLPHCNIPRLYAYGINPRARQLQMALVTSSGPSRVATHDPHTNLVFLRFISISIESESGLFSN